MKCPYCFEEIIDAALVCKHCGRDFQLFIPLIGRVDALEKQIATIHVILKDLGTTHEIPAPNVSSPRPISVVTVSTLVVLTTSCGSLFSYWLFRKTNEAIFLDLAVAAPAVGGFLQGLIVRGSHVKLYLLQGALVGLIDFVGTLLIYTGSLWPMPFDWEQIVLVYLVGQVIIFVLSGITADLLEKRIMHPLELQASTNRLANLLASLGAERNSRDFQKGVEVWKAFLGVAAPIFTLIGTLITGHWTYLAALAKK